MRIGQIGRKKKTLFVSPLDMMGLMGMAQVIAIIAYGIRGLRRGETTWRWPDFNPDPVQENLAQLSRWAHSLQSNDDPFICSNGTKLSSFHFGNLEMLTFLNPETSNSNTNKQVSELFGICFTFLRGTRYKVVCETN